MKQIIDKSCFPTRKYEVVDEFPSDYIVWPIGRRNFQYECYIPLAKPIKGEYEFQANIDPFSLKCIKVESEALALQILKEAVRKGVDRNRYLEIVNQF